MSRNPLMGGAAPAAAPVAPMAGSPSAGAAAESATRAADAMGDSLLDRESLPRFDELLESLSDSELHMLDKYLEEVTFKDGETFIRQGEPNHHLFIVKNGVARIVLVRDDGGRQKLTTLTVGHIIGEISFLMSESASANTEAEGDLVLYALPREHFEAVLLEDPTLAFKFMMALNKVLCYRLKRINKELAKMRRGS